MQTPEELIGKEPSLIELMDYVKNNNECFEDLSIDVLYRYSKNKTGNMKDKYYLGGQIIVSITDRITAELIESVKDADKKRIEEYGVPDIPFEISSVAYANKLFKDIQEIIARYYKVRIHELYRPPNGEPGDAGGEMYQQLASKTNIGK